MSYKYMIYTCNARRWYVNKFLIPSMLEQGIEKDEIIVTVDSKNQGVLITTLQMFDWIGRTQDWNENIWHLQDDVIISSDFKEKTNTLYGDIVCGFCSKYDESKKFGLVGVDEMWYSFPCISINNYVAKEFAKWFFDVAIYSAEYKERIMARKYIDLFFKEFVRQFYRPLKIFNSNPNLVDHVDWLIGGSLINSQRPEKQIRSYYWNENNRVSELQKNIEQMFG